MSNNVLWAGYRADCWVGNSTFNFEIDSLARCYFGKLKSSTTYTITRLDTSNRLRIGVGNVDMSDKFATVANAYTQSFDKTSDPINTPFTFTTGASEQYITVYYTSAGDPAPRIMLNEGTSILPYEPPTEPIPYSWLITDGINNNYPYISDVPLPAETVFSEPYPHWMWRIDPFYNDGYPYLIGLRLPYVIPDDKYVDGHGLAVIWEHLLNLLEDKADISYVDSTVAETVLVNSTTETATNQKWLDGKPIYRKVFDIDNASLTAGTTQIALDVLNAETITNLHATIEYTASTSLINVNSYWCSDLIPIATSQIIKIECTDGNLEINKQNDMSVDYENLKITIEFTKTTD